MLEWLSRHRVSVEIPFAAAYQICKLNATESCVMVLELRLRRLFFKANCAVTVLNCSAFAFFLFDL